MILIASMTTLNSQRLIINVQLKQMMYKTTQKVRHTLLQQIRHALKSLNCEDYCFKGNQSHFLYLQERKVKNDSKIYCIDKTAVDLALQMAMRRQKVLTLITPMSYETVIIKNNKQRNNLKQLAIHQQQFQQYFTESNTKVNKKYESIPKIVSQIALNILQNQRFVVKTSSLDIHPYQSYKKLCGYILARKDKNITKYFNQTSFSNNPLPQNISLAAFMKEVRQKYINTDSFKLKTLTRRNPNEYIDQQTKKAYIQRWKKAVHFNLIETAVKESFDQSTKIKWAIQNKLGTVVTQEEIVKNKFRKYYYATWV